MKKMIAQSVLEYVLLFAIVAVISVTVYSVIHSKANVTKLSNLSKVTLRK